MNIDKAAGIDNLSGKFLKDAANILAKPISEICNLSIKYSVFPTDCRIAKLKPLFKKGSTTLPKNYRAISLLPLISKIFEKVVHTYLGSKRKFFKLVILLIKETKALNIVSFESRNAHSNPLFCKHEIHKFHDKIIIEKCLFILH